MSKRKEVKKLKEGIEWRDCDIKELEDEIDKKNEEIKYLKGEAERQRERIKRMSQQLFEKELYEKKVQEFDGGDIKVIERLCWLEAHIEAQENPYFF